MYDNRCIVLGGSFNPPTVAHEKLMRHAMEHAGAAWGVFVPSSHAYVSRKMKKAGGGPVFSEAARLEMLRAMTWPKGALRADTCEYGDDGRGHTYLTMTKLRAADPGKEYCFLLGADKLKILPRWHDIEKFLQEFRFAVMSRDRDDAGRMIRKDPLLAKYADRFLVIPELDGIGHISSTAARERLAANDLDGAGKLLGPEIARICVRELDAGRA